MVRICRGNMLILTTCIINFDDGGHIWDIEPTSGFCSGLGNSYFCWQIRWENAFKKKSTDCINRFSYPWSRAQPLLWAFILLEPVSCVHSDFFFFTYHDSMSETLLHTVGRLPDLWVCTGWCAQSSSLKMCGEMILWRCGCTSDRLATLLRTWTFCVTLNWTGCKDYWLFCMSSVSDGHGGLPRGSDWPILSLPAADPHLPTSGQLWCTKGWGGGVWTEQGG